jgi:hypothetical protein
MLITISDIPIFPDDGICGAHIEIQTPSNCPMCNTVTQIEPITNWLIRKDNENNELFSFYFCSKCEKFFIGHYEVLYYQTTNLISFSPKESYNTKDFPKLIQKLSPDFCEIHNQAYIAQQQGLTKISGIGYRKALEFLVKDYVIFLNPNESVNIKSLNLSSCISKYIESSQIKSLATAATWIGNDETHYIKKNLDYNIEDMLVFIDVMVSFINTELVILDAQKFTESKNNNKSQNSTNSKN